MLVQATVPLLAPTLPNGQTPISAGQIQASQAYLFRVNTAADNAKAAVLGSCQVPVSLTDTSGAGTSSSAVLAWIQSNPWLTLGIGAGLLFLMKGRR
jgi:hypothetical protein